MDLVRLDTSDDPDGRKVNAILAAHVRAERARAWRGLLVHVVALLSAPLWITALVEPHGLLRTLALLAWAGSAGLLVIAVVGEWRARQRESASLESLASGRPPGSNSGA